MHPRQKQAGVALIVVLLIVAIVTVLATDMITRLQLNVSRTMNIQSNNQAYWFSMGAEHYAKKSLADLRTLNPETIHLQQAWAQDFLFPIEGGTIEAKVIDMHACFNINALADAAGKDALVAFRRLMELLNNESIDSYVAENVSNSLADWLDADDNVRDLGAEDAEYESLANPYVAANSMMTNRSELRLINGVEPLWLDDLLAQVCVLPQDNSLQVNINTLHEEHAPVLAALTDLSIDTAKRLINARPGDGYADIADFLQDPELKDLTQVQKDWLSVKSNYFMLNTKTRYNGASFNIQTVFQVFNVDQVTVLSREFGGMN